MECIVSALLAAEEFISSKFSIKYRKLYSFVTIVIFQEPTQCYDCIETKERFILQSQQMEQDQYLKS